MDHFGFRRRRASNAKLRTAMAPGAADHPLAQVDERVLMPARHGIGQLAQLDGKFVQILAQRHVVHPATLDHPAGVVTSRCLLAAYSFFPAGGRGMMPEVRGARALQRPRSDWECRRELEEPSIQD